MPSSDGLHGPSFAHARAGTMPLLCIAPWGSHALRCRPLSAGHRAWPVVAHAPKAPLRLIHPLAMAFVGQVPCMATCVRCCSASRRARVPFAQRRPSWALRRTRPCEADALSASLRPLLPLVGGLRGPDFIPRPCRREVAFTPARGLLPVSACMSVLVHVVVGSPR